MAETLANKEKSSQIAVRNFFPMSFYAVLWREFSAFTKEKDESCVKRNEELGMQKMVNAWLCLVNGLNYYANAIDLSDSNY